MQVFIVFVFVHGSGGPGTVRPDPVGWPECSQKDEKKDTIKHTVFTIGNDENASGKRKRRKHNFKCNYEIKPWLLLGNHRRLKEHLNKHRTATTTTSMVLVAFLVLVFPL